MTKRLLLTNWLDVLYNAVRKAPGGTGTAAQFLTERRGATISEEGLRSRLTRTDGKTPTGEQLELLTEHLVETRQLQALDWIKALAARFGLVAIDIPPAPAGGWDCEITAINDKVMESTVLGGTLAAIAQRVLADKRVTVPEADEMSAQIRAEIQLLLRLDRNVRRAAGLEVD